jgi:hypothetical protein
MWAASGLAFYAEKNDERRTVLSESSCLERRVGRENTIRRSKKTKFRLDGATVLYRLMLKANRCLARPLRQNRQTMPLEYLRQPIVFPAGRNLCPDRSKVKHFPLANFAASLGVTVPQLQSRVFRDFRFWVNKYSWVSGGPEIHVVSLHWILSAPGFTARH